MLLLHTHHEVVAPIHFFIASKFKCLVVSLTIPSFVFALHLSLTLVACYISDVLAMLEFGGGSELIKYKQLSLHMRLLL